MSEKAFSWLIPNQIYTRRRENGFSDAEILALPDDLRQVVNQVMRREPVRLDELTSALGRPADDVRGQVVLLTAQGWLKAEEIEGEIHYRARLKRRRVRNLPPGIWQVLEGTWNLRLFQYLDDAEKTAFTHAFELEYFEAGQHLFTAGEWGHSMYMLDSGLVEMVTQDAEGREVVLARLKPGDIIGEVAVLLGERRWATARAVEQVSAWRLHKDDLDHLLARSPSAGLAVRREIERRVRGLDRRTQVLSSAYPSFKKIGALLVVGSGVIELAEALSSYTGERLLVLDLRSAPPLRVVGIEGGPPQAGGNVEHRAAHHLDSKELAVALRRGLDEFDRVFVAAPAELHSPLMSVIRLIELVIDLSDAKVPWVVAAARRRWTIPAAGRADIERIARQLCQRLVGLALSGGAARALAHIGVLRALEEARVPIDMIASTGMGAVIAGLYAAGYSVDELSDLVTRRDRDLNPFDGSLNLRLASRSALYAGKRARNTVHRLLEGRTFADLRLPLYVVVTDLESGQPVILEQGPLTEAVQASLALAGLVAPTKIAALPVEPGLTVESAPGERLLVDGCLVNPMPADILVERGAGLVVGVNTIPRPLARRVRLQEVPKSRGGIDLTSTWLRLRDQLAHTAITNSLHYTDLLIMPPVDQFDDTDFDRAAELIAIGLTATQREVNRIQTLLSPDRVALP